MTISSKPAGRLLTQREWAKRGLGEGRAGPPLGSAAQRLGGDEGMGEKHHEAAGTGGPDGNQDATHRLQPEQTPASEDFLAGLFMRPWLGRRCVGRVLPSTEA